MRNEDLTILIREFEMSYILERSKNICVLNQIENEQLDFCQKKRSYILEEDEKPLVLLNKKKRGFSYITHPGMLITSKGIHYSTIKRNFFASLLPLKEKSRMIKWECIKSFQIGQHDGCYGTAYVGHDLIINDEQKGLLRMGYSVFYDEHAIKYINNLSNFLYERGLLTKKPIEYFFQ